MTSQSSTKNGTGLPDVLRIETLGHNIRALQEKP
jgi:hypothetical protein